MKTSTFLIALILIQSVSAVTFAENNSFNREVLGLVTEWRPTSSSIQVDNYFITRLPKIFIDFGNNKIVPGGTSDINEGCLAKVSLTGKDENGSWRASQVILFAGKGIEAILNETEEEKRESLVQTMKRVEQSFLSPNQLEKKQEAGTSKGTVYYKDGIWRN